MYAAVPRIVPGVPWAPNTGACAVLRILTCDIACNSLNWVRASVLDTDVLVAAFRSSSGASRQILLAALARRFELLLSVPLMFEYEAVLSRPEHSAASGASPQDVIQSVISNAV